MEKFLIPVSAVLSMTGGLCADCQETVRRTIARNQINAKATTLQRLEKIMDEAQSEYGIGKQEIIFGGQHRELVRIRRAIAVRAREQGFSYPQIGGLLQMHHTSIMHLVGVRDGNANKTT